MEDGSIHTHDIGQDLKDAFSGGSAVAFHGVVQKIVDGMGPELEKVEIVIRGADDLYKEIRIPNELRNASGEKVQLQTGTHVAVIIVARVPVAHPVGTQIDEVEARPA